MKKICIFLHFFYGLCAHAIILNIPYQMDMQNQKIMHRYLTDFPKTLDPGEVYDNVGLFLLGQVYEQLYGYENNQIYPLLAENFPKMTFLNIHKQKISATDIPSVAYTVYTIPIRKNIVYQPHPALPQPREVTADDFVYAFKRAAFNEVDSPIARLLSQRILGFDDFLKNPQVQLSIEGVRALNQHTLQIITKGYYAQFIYWLAMPLLAPIPPEVGAFNQALGDKDAWRWTSIGTGPFMIYNDKSYQSIHLKKNPNFRDQYIQRKNQRVKLPILDGILFHLEKESIPRWNKFLQGYYDYSSIPSETYEKVVWTGPQGQTQLSPQLTRQHVQMNLISTYDINAIAFNMEDKILGHNLFLRKAISIAFNFSEFINIFQNNYTKSAHGPLPPLIIRSLNIHDFNPYLFNKVGQHHLLKSIAYARHLMKKAGYANGINPQTGKHLVLIMDVESTGKPSERAIFNWYRKKMSLLGIHLQIRENDRNRYQSHIKTGNYQMTPFSWMADYPDAENFFMLFYGPHSKKHFSGQNLSNYQNPRFDQLFRQFSTNLEPANKQKIAQELYDILIHDAVWVWGTHSKLLFLSYQWVDLFKPNSAYFTGISKYFDLNPKIRLAVWQSLNQAKWLALFIILMLLMVVFLPFLREWRNMNVQAVKRTSF